MRVAAKMSPPKANIKKILIVDDEKAIRDSLDVFLSNKGHEVVTHPNPAYCDAAHADCTHCRKEEPCADVMLVDLRMPFKSGVEMLLLQGEKGCKINFDKKAVISAYISEENAAALEEMGVQYFEKPLLYSDIRSWLEGRLEDETDA